MIGNQNLTYTRLLLDPALQIHLSPFSQPDKLDTEGNDGFMENAFFYPTCKVSPTLAKNRVYCGFFSNYGSDSITLLAFLVLNAAIAYLGLMLLKKKIISNDDDDLPDLPSDATIKQKLKHQMRKLTYTIITSFGFSFFIVKMESNTLNIMIYIFVNIFEMENAWQMWIGLLASVIILLYYGLYLWMIWRFARDLAIKIKAPTLHKKNVENTSSQFRTHSIKDRIKYNQLKFGFVGKLYENYRSDISQIDMYYPIATFIRSTVIALWVVVLSDFEIAAPVMIASTEVAYLCFCLYTRVRSERIENIVDVFNCTSRVFYCFLACLSLSSAVSTQSIDIVMFFTLFSITGLNIFFATYIIILLIYDIVVGKVCGQTNHEERYARSNEDIERRLPQHIVAYRKQVLQALHKKPRVIHRKTVISLRRDPQWGPAIEEEEKILMSEIMERIKLKMAARTEGINTNIEENPPTPNINLFQVRDENMVTENQALPYESTPLFDTHNIEQKNFQK